MSLQQGVRGNNSIANFELQAKFSQLFLGVNIPFYMRACIRYSIVKIQCPGKVRVFIKKHKSYRASVKDSKT